MHAQKQVKFSENLDLQSGCHDLGYGNGCQEKPFQTLVCERNKNCGGGGSLKLPGKLELFWMTQKNLSPCT